jgi:uncharacterized protein YkwD
MGDVRARVLLSALAAAVLAGCGGGDEPAPGPGTPRGFCAPTAGWPAAWAAFEDEVLARVNAARAAGATCGADAYPPAAPLRHDPALRCAARLHSKDMHDRDFFAHDSPDGTTPWARMEAAGYAWSRAGENIAWGYRTPAAVVAGWLASPGHCRNILAAGFRDLGVGYYEGASGGPWWTQDFGAPR